MRYHVLLSAAVAALVSFLFVSYVRPTPVTAPTQPARQSTLDRIVQSKTLRCGYVPYNPLIIKDPQTGEISGIGADVHQRIAEILGAKIEWTAEANWPTYIEDLKAGRYDMLCDMDFTFPAYVGQLATNLPVFYTVATAWARPENAARFLNKPADVFNSPDVMVSAVDGTMPLDIARHDFPKAKILGMPATNDYSLNLVNVVEKKADVTFVERIFGEQFLKSNPGTLVDVTPNTPLRTYAYSIPSLPGDVKMKEAMESIISYMINNGEIDKILKKYGAENGYFVAAQPYRKAE